MFEISLFGRGGQGIVTAASVIADAALHDGRYPQKMPVYGAARRGDTVKAFVRVDTEPVLLRAPILTPDCVMICDASIPLHDAGRGLRASGVLVLNDAGIPDVAARAGVRTFCCVDANAVSREVFGPLPIPLTGIIMVGALLRAVSVIGEASVRAVLGRYVSRDMLEKNLRALHEGFTRARLESNEKAESGYLFAPAAWDDADLLPYQELSPGPVFTPETLVDLKTGSWRSKRPRIDAARCRACGRCRPICPEGVVWEDNEEMVIDYDYCKGCGICARECPCEAISMVEEQ
jgi:pyruvate ferredoxin oxidoreductase gamma subunit